jgi:hypothetical protein
MHNALRVSEQLYSALLYLYPKQFRIAYGQHMCLTFRDVCRAAYHQNGTRGLLALWLATLLDLVKSAFEERARQGEITMSKSRLIALAGPLTILVGLLWLVAASGDFLLQSELVSDETFVSVVAIPFFLSFIPLLFALIGTRLRFQQSVGIVGRFGMALSVAGCAGLMVSLLASAAAPEAGQPSWVNYIAFGCVLSIRIGYILFGIDALRYRLLPRGQLLPLLVGATVVLSLPLDWFGVPALLPSEWANAFLHFTISGVCWLLLGIAMMEQRREPQPAADESAKISAVM